MCKGSFTNGHLAASLRATSITSPLPYIEGIVRKVFCLRRSIIVLIRLNSLDLRRRGEYSPHLQVVQKHGGKTGPYRNHISTVPGFYFLFSLLLMEFSRLKKVLAGVSVVAVSLSSIGSVFAA